MSTLDEVEFWEVDHRYKEKTGKIHLIGTTLQRKINLSIVKEFATDSWSYMFWHGIVSGYPLCCILYFCDVWYNFRKEKRMFSGKEAKDWDFNMGYVLCPNCAIDCMCIRNPKLEMKLKRLA